MNHRPVVMSNPGRWRPGDNPFLKLLFESLEGYAEIEHFTWRRALFGRYDILHVHWLEYLMRGPTMRIRVVKRVLFAALIVRLRLGRTPSLWTVHNETPHERASRLELSLMRLWSATVTHKVVLNASSIFAGQTDSTLIPHGHYRPILSGDGAKRTPVRGQVDLLFFGFLRKYKGLENLITLVGQAELIGTTPQVRLKVIGSPNESEYGRELERLARGFKNVEIIPRFLTDAEIENEICASDGVILPYLRMQNSGAALLALSCRRPIIVPASPSMVELQAEVGPTWVSTFAPPLTAAGLDQALALLPLHTMGAEPDLSRREWAVIAKSYSVLYEFLIARSRRDRRQFRANRSAL